MNRLEAKEVALEPFRDLLGGIAGQRPPVALCDLDGEVLLEAGDGRTTIGAILAELVEKGFVWERDASGLHQRRVAGERQLVYHELSGPTAPIGWLAALVPESVVEEAERAGRLSSAMEAVAGAISNQLHLAAENASLANEVARRYEELSVVYSLDSVSMRSGSPDGGIQTLLDNLAKQTGVDLAVFLSSDEDEPCFAHGHGDPISSLDLVLTQLRGDVFRFLAVDHRTLILNRPDDPRRQFLLPHMRHKILATSVERRDFRGILVLLRRESGTDFENSDRALSQVLAQQISTTRRNERLIATMQRFGEQLAGALIEAMEAKDPYTRGHSERVQIVAVQIGRAINLPHSDLRELYWGSILHDIGKIGVPDAILLKPGRLDEAEYTFIKTHPERSYEILSHIEYLNTNMLNGARYHHERVDGRGYPFGLEGARIPIHARIIAVADTYDAMTSSRAYRAAMSHDIAMEQIGEVAGTQLDEEVVHAFAALCRSDPEWLKRATGDPFDKNG